MAVFWFYFWIILCYTVIAAAFIILMAISSAEERRERERERCMMNHPAGSRARIEHSLTGPINGISTFMDRENRVAGYSITRFKPPFLFDQEENSCLPRSSEGFSSRPYHLEGD